MISSSLSSSLYNPLKFKIFEKNMPQQNSYITSINKIYSSNFISITRLLFLSKVFSILHGVLPNFLLPDYLSF